jgi:hypothetical protein
MTCFQLSQLIWKLTWWPLTSICFRLCCVLYRVLVEISQLSLTLRSHGAQTFPDLNRTGLRAFNSTRSQFLGFEEPWPRLRELQGARGSGDHSLKKLKMFLGGHPLPQTHQLLLGVTRRSPKGFLISYCHTCVFSFALHDVWEHLAAWKYSYRVWQ